jgi:methylmalonyl-CoA mutase
MTKPELDLPLAEGFEARDEAAWLKQIEKVLKGADFEKRLVSETADDIKLRPLYMQAASAAPLAAAKLTARAAHPWAIIQRIDNPDLAAANAQALSDLEAGATALDLIADDGFDARGFGLPQLDADVLDELFNGVALDMITLRLGPSFDGPARAAALADLIERRGHAPADVAFHTALAPLSQLAATGTLAVDWPATADELVVTVNDLTARGFKGPLITADARPVNEAGGSEAQELAFALAAAAAYLRALTERGLDVAGAARQLSFALAIDAGQFEGIAKLRALRKLWARVLDAADLALAPVHIHAETAWRMLTKRDAGVNMLRATLATFVAGIAGADSLTVLPHTQAHGLPDGFARRVARNTQNVLIEESNLWRVADPAAGAGATEELTDALCAEAWRLFQQIEGTGGLVDSLAAGQLQESIGDVASRRATRIAKRADPITGTSEFPFLNEASVKVLAALAGPARPKTLDQPGLTVQGLRSERLGEDYEALRDAADAHAEATGSRPVVFLANLGPIAEHTVRATWIRNLLAAGGIDVIPTDGFSDTGVLGNDFAQSGAKVACICSNDDNYENLGDAAAQALRTAGATHVLLAGKPGDHEKSLRAAGVDEFLYAGIDVLAELKALHEKLGVQG